MRTPCPAKNDDILPEPPAHRPLDRHACPLKTLLVIAYSRTGGTRQMADAAIHAAAQEGDVTVRSLNADAAGPDDLIAADGYLFATPENLASMAGAMKEFFDRCYYPVLGRIDGRPYASLICAGSDGHGAARQIERIATGWRLRAVAPPTIVCTHAQTPEAILASKTIARDDLARCAEIGQTLTAGLALGIW